MRSALYYPHTRNVNTDLWKTALLLWDEVDHIVPFAGYQTDYQNKDHAAAAELIARFHVPSKSEKKETHMKVKSLIESGLPETFFYKERSRDSDNFRYQIYLEKLLPETWDLLREAGIAGRGRHTKEGSMTDPAGLSIMSILADCCAGETRTRITDRGLAYATLANMTSSKIDEDKGQEYHRLVPITMKIIDLNYISLQELIDFRRRESIESGGYSLTSMRRSYLKSLEEHTKNLSKLSRQRDRENCTRDFESDMRIDLNRLKREITGSAIEAAFSKETVISVLAAVTASYAAIKGLPFEIPAAFTLTGVPITIGGGVCTLNKYSTGREAIMQKHPMAYMYQLQKECA